MDPVAACLTGVSQPRAWRRGAGMPERVNVLGVGVSAIDMARALDLIDRWIAARARQYVCVTGVHGVMECQDDAALRDIHNRAGLVTPDHRHDPRFPWWILLQLSGVGRYDLPSGRPERVS